jgi:hypothetical protein
MKVRKGGGVTATSVTLCSIIDQLAHWCNQFSCVGELRAKFSRHVLTHDGILVNSMNAFIQCEDENSHVEATHIAGASDLPATA